MLFSMWIGVAIMTDERAFGPSRRSLLGSAAASVAAAGISANAALAGEKLSCPEFNEWQRLALKTRDWFGSEEHQHATNAESNAVINPLWRGMHELEAAIYQKPVAGNLAHVMQLGIIALYWNDDEQPGTVFLDGGVLGLRSEDSTDNRTRGHLIRAVCMLAQATGQFPALADSKFDLPGDCDTCACRSCLP